MSINLLSYAETQQDWRSDWITDEGFRLDIDTNGYNFPSAIAFVPNPGSEPKDPLYFITELRGKVKVVTNDRTVYTFAENFFQFKPTDELPNLSGENGLAGICLDPEHGYVFVTFVYQDADNIPRNNVIRFQSKPETFSIKPYSQLAFTDIFSREGSSPSHQIGPCQVYNESLYVSVGDGFNVGGTNNHDFIRSQNVDSLLGKIIRMSLDGKPIKNNPFYVDNDIKKARNYIWAVGLRNPFGLKIVDSLIFVADNGPTSDRFIEVNKGENFMWDGSDLSIGTNALVVFVPGHGVTTLDYYPRKLNIFPAKYRGKFYLSICGAPSFLGERGIVTLDYDFEDKKMLTPPNYFLIYQGATLQIIASLAFGPDGLYVVPLLPLSNGSSAVIKISYNEEDPSPYKFEKIALTAPFLLESYGCYGCHVLYDNGWGTKGPSLNREPLISRIEKRLNSSEYIKSVKELNKLHLEPYRSYREAREKVLELTGEYKIKTWIKYHILEPKFDNPYSQMPNMGLTENEAQLISEYLIDHKVPFKIQVWNELKKHIPTLHYRYLFYTFLLGASLSLIFVGLYKIVRK